MIVQRVAARVSSILLACLALAACVQPIAPPGGPAAQRAPDATYAPEIDPALFTTTIDNPYFPLAPGTTLIYEGESGEGREHIETVVTDGRKQVLGVETVVVEDSVWIDGELVEKTYDWYAQDSDGNVWYFGEASQDYENGQPSTTAGSWEAGVDGALPGIIMPAQPTVGEPYRQEYYLGEAEDMAQVTDTEASVTTGIATYDDVLVTEEWTPLEPGWMERKSYAPGVGLILIEFVQGGEGRIELIETRPAP